MSYTTHGHHIPGTGVDGFTGIIARCGGPGICVPCSKDAGWIGHPVQGHSGGLTGVPEVIMPGAIKPTTTSVPVYLGSGKDRPKVGSATFDGKRVVVEFNDTKTADMLRNLMDENVLKTLSFAYLPGNPILKKDH